MSLEIVNCGFNPPRANQAKPAREVDCGSKPPRKVEPESSEEVVTAGVDVQKESAPTSITKHPRKS